LIRLDRKYFFTAMTIETEKTGLDGGVAAQTVSNEFGIPGSSVSAFDPQVIRKLRLKIDFIILPTLATMYTFK